MSNFKKFLSLVLATLMVASMMVITAPSAAAYTATGDYATDITLLSSLGVMLGDGTSYQEKENVTRWQMALLIARIVTGEIGNEMWEAEKSEYFTDVKADHYPGAIDFCAEMGYIKGIGDNLFDPEGNIIYQDALTMLVRVLGYETETTSYPWGYILQARTLELTNDISTGNKTNLLREEVANLLATALYVPLATEGKVIDTDATTDGVQATALIITGLKGLKLGTGTLIAAPTAGYGEEPTGSITDGALKFLLADGSTVAVVDMANLTKKDDIHINDYLGFTADLVAVNIGTANEAILATMHDVNYYDSHTYSSTSGSQKLTIDGTNYYPYIAAGYTKLLKYGTATNQVFVDAVFSDGNFANKGRVFVCNGGNDNDPSNDIIRFVPFNTVRALYGFNLKVTAATDTVIYGLNKNDYLVTYFEPMYGYYAVNTPESVTTSSGLKEENWIIGLNAYDALKGVIIDDGFGLYGASDSISAFLRKRVKQESWGTVAHRAVSELYVAVSGELVNGAVHKGATYVVGDVTFVTVGNTVEFASGTATITGITDEKIKLGDTAYSVGYNSKIASGHVANIAGDTTTRVNGWYANFTDSTFSAAVTANLYEEVTYYTADGVVISIVGENDVVNNPNTKDALILCIADDGSNVTVNADGTISVVAFNLETLKEETVKLGQINGKNPGTLINSFGLGVAAPILVNGFVVTEDTITSDVIAALLADGNDYVIDVDGMDYVLIAVANETDGVYDVSVASNAYLDRVILNNAAATGIQDTATTVTLNFRGYTASALAIDPYFAGTFVGYTNTDPAYPLYTYAEGILSVDKETEYVIFGANGVVNTTGVLPAATGSSITLSDAAGAIVLELSSDKIVIFNANSNVNAIAAYVGSPAATTGTTNGGWYTLTWKTDYDSMTAVKVGDVTYYNYVFKNMYNLTTKQSETVTISSPNYYATPETGIFGSNWTSGKNTPVTDKGQTAVRYLYDVWYIGTQVGAGAQKSSIYTWGLENGYNIGIIQDIEYNNPNKLVIDAVTPDCDVDGTLIISNLNDTDEDALNTDIVVSYTISLMYQLKGTSTADAIRTAEYNDFATDDFQRWALSHPNNGNRAELVLYKLDDNGCAEVFINWADRFDAATTTITDVMAKAADFN